MRKSLKNKKPLATFKRRRFVTRVFKSLTWGTSGVKLLNRLLMQHDQLEWLGNLVKWHYKRNYKRDFYQIGESLKKSPAWRCAYWTRVRSLLPCTRKSSHARMGRGKGKIDGHFATLAAGYFLLEFKYTNEKKFKILCKFLQSRLTCKLQGVYRNNFTYFRLFSNFIGSYGRIRRASHKEWLDDNYMLNTKFRVGIEIL